MFKPLLDTVSISVKVRFLGSIYCGNKEEAERAGAFKPS